MQNKLPIAITGAGQQDQTDLLRTGMTRYGIKI